MSNRNRKTPLGAVVRGVENIIHNPDPRSPGFSEKGLYLLSRCYAKAVRAREQQYARGVRRQQRLPCRVISVGNIAAGGSGKTPMTLHLARGLLARGLRPVVISRGYKARMERSGGIVSDGRRILAAPDQAGDEPFMIASELPEVPVLVGADRFRAGELAVRRFSPDVVILDDGFQHRRVHRDVDLLLIDGSTGFGNGHLLPRGPLREPVSALWRADAVILTRMENADPSAVAAVCQKAAGIPVFRSVHRPWVYGVARQGGKNPLELESPAFARDLGFLADARVFGFSGIAGNREFQRMVTAISGQVTGFIAYPDHYRYNEADLEHIAKQAASAGADWIVTTQKDYPRIRAWGRLPASVAVIGIRPDLGAEHQLFCSFLGRRLGRPL